MQLINTKINNMPYSTCCGAHTTMPEMGICPDCLDHCDWEEEDEEDCCIKYEEEADNQIEQNKINKTT
jgi:hypothetical protein